MRRWRIPAALLAAGLILLFARAVRPLQERVEAVAGEEVVISVPGIPGPYCAYGIEKRLSELPAVRRVELDWGEEEIRVLAVGGRRLSVAEVARAVEASEYPYKYDIRP